MGKTLFISDLDGTLLNRNAELSDFTKDALSRMIADGLYFSSATARTPASALKILDGVHWNVPHILLNGVLIYDFAQKRYAQVLPFSAKNASEIIRILQRLDTPGLMYQLKDNEQITYFENLDHKPLCDFVEERKVRYNKVFKETNFADVPQNGINYFFLLDTEWKIKLAHEAFSSVSNICLSVYRDIYSPDLWYLELHDDKATKRNGVLHLRETYGFERVVGFGDNLNDLPMFAACDVRIAVENAVPEVKAAADYICNSNDNDSVIKWIGANL